MQVSILTIHYNQSDTIKKLYTSLLPQKDYIKEIIIYDDGSEPYHVEELKKLSGLHEKLILAKHKGKHLTNHFNRALEFVTGDIVMQIFGDSYLAEDALKKLSETYVPNSVGCGYEYLVDTAGNIKENDYRYQPNDDVIDATGQPRAYFGVIGNSLVAPTALLKKIGGADERFTGYGKDDTDLALRLFMNGARIVFYNNVKIFHPFERSEKDSADNTALLKDKIEGRGYTSEAKTIVLDFDDFSLENNQMLYLEKLKSVFPNLKVSMFTIPWDYVNYQRMQDFQRDEVIRWIKSNLEWIEIIPHGLTHKPREFESLSYDDYEIIFGAINEVFEKYDLPYIQGFKAPYWLYNQSLVNYLDKKGWFMASDRNQAKAPRAKKNYIYTHSIDEPFWLSLQDEIRLHGHISRPSSNNLEDNIMNLLKINPSAEFKFVSELFIEEEPEEKKKC